MLTLGINAVFRDSAACMVRDGVVIAAAEEKIFHTPEKLEKRISFINLRNALFRH